MGKSEKESSIFQLNIQFPKEINSVRKVSTDSALFALHAFSLPDALYVVFQ